MSNKEFNDRVLEALPGKALWMIALFAGEKFIENQYEKYKNRKNGKKES